MGSTPSGPFSAAAGFTGDSVTPTLKEGDEPNESDVMVDEWRDRDAKLNDCTCRQDVTYHRHRDQRYEKQSSYEDTRTQVCMKQVAALPGRRKLEHYRS